MTNCEKATRRPPAKPQKISGRAEKTPLALARRRPITIHKGRALARLQEINIRPSQKNQPRKSLENPSFYRAGPPATSLRFADDFCIDMMVQDGAYPHSLGVQGFAGVITLSLSFSCFSCHSLVRKKRTEYTHTHTHTHTHTRHARTRMT